MKKKFCLVIIFCCFLIIGFIGMGCNEKSLEEVVSHNISEYRTNYFVGRTEDLFVSFTDGKREQDFKADGKKTNLLDYGVVVVYGDFSEIPKFELKINDDKFSGTMERNPFDGTFVFDIEKRIQDENLNEIEISIIEKDKKEQIKLNKLSNKWKIDEDKALNIFIDKNHKGLDKVFMSGSKNSGEIFIKLVTDKKDDGNIYWYVLCVSTNGEVIANLIDVSNGEIVQ